MNEFLKYDYSRVPSPCYVVEEELLRRNLSLIRSVAERADVEIILAFKAFALWRTFPIFREYIEHSTASSLAEARMAFEKFGSKAHTYAPIYTDQDFPQIAACSSHITFNSLTQYTHFAEQARAAGVSCGLRINPEFSDVTTDLYNPCAPGSRLGVTADALGENLPEGLEGLHFHTLCESSSYDLERTLAVVEAKFGRFLGQIKWLNMGGGHLMTRADYDVEHLVKLLTTFRQKYPHLRLILEPGSAFAWRTGVLVSTVQDVVENHDIRTAMLDVSFACHMPDCLEMPYKPAIVGATDAVTGKPTYRMGGNSCLSGDFCGSWSFDRALRVGDRIVFEDMIHYTTVKTTMFNGISHPSIVLRHCDGTLETLRHFSPDDYFARMD